MRRQEALPASLETCIFCFAPFLDPGRTLLPDHYDKKSVAPANCTTKAPSVNFFRDSIYTALQTCCLPYRRHFWSPAKTRFRWVGQPFPDGLVTARFQQRLSGSRSTYSLINSPFVCLLYKFSRGYPRLTGLWLAPTVLIRQRDTVLNKWLTSIREKRLCAPTFFDHRSQI